MSPPRRLMVLHSGPEGLGQKTLSAVEAIVTAVEPIWPQARLAINRLAPVPPGWEGRTHRILTDSDKFRTHWDDDAAVLPLISEINPLAERCAYLTTTMGLGAEDAFFLPEADIADLEMLAEFFLTRPLRQTPCVFAHVRALAPRRGPGRARLATRMARLGRRLDRLDVTGTRLALTAESGGLAAYLSANGLAAEAARLDPASVRPSTPGQGRGPSIAIASDDTSLAALEALDGFAARLIQRAPDRPPSLRLLRTVVPPPDSDFAVAARRIDALTVEAMEEADLTFDEPDVLCADDVSVPILLERPGAFAGKGTTIVPLPHGAPLSAVLAAVEAALAEEAAPALPPALSDVMRAWSPPRFPDKDTPVVVHVAPAWSGAGSSHVFEAQLRTLEERGFAVFAVHLDTNTQAATGKMTAATIVSRLAGENATARWLVCRQRESVLAEQKYDLVPPYKLGLFSLEGEGRVAQTAEIPVSLSQALAARKPQAILLNYAHLTPFIPRLDLPDVPVMLETHDVRSVQHAIYNKSPLDETDRALEFELFAHSDLTVFINKAEEDEFLAHHEGHPSASIFPFLDEPVGVKEDPLATSATWALELANHPAGDPAVIDELLSRPSAPPLALFVGTDHRANVNSLHWYLAEVVAPHLAGSDLTTVIIGNIDAFFVGQSLPNVHFFGRVPTLEPWYDRADVILLPVREGTGLPIKTLDAIRRRKPFVASSQALRAIPGMIDLFGAYDAPQTFAARVAALSADPALRQVETDKLNTFAEREAPAGRYGAAWDEVLSRVGVSSHRQTERFRPSKRPPLTLPAEPVDGTAALAPGKGLGPLAHVVAQDDGTLVQTRPYGRLRVRVDEPAPGRLMLHAHALTDEDLLVAIFCDGAPVGRTRLGAEPVPLALPLPPGQGPREHIFEFWVREGAPRRAVPGTAGLFALSDLFLDVERAG